MKARLSLLLVAVAVVVVVVVVVSDNPSPSPRAKSSSTSSATSSIPAPVPPAGVSDKVAACDAEADTVAISECFNRLRGDLERQLDDVTARLEAALLNVETNPDLAGTPEAGALSEVRADLANAEQAWSEYRNTVCHAAVLYAIGGTFRNVVGPRCDVIVLEARIRALEESFSL